MTSYLAERRLCLLGRSNKTVLYIFNQSSEVWYVCLYAYICFGLRHRYLSITAGLSTFNLTRHI